MYLVTVVLLSTVDHATLVLHAYDGVPELVNALLTDLVFVRD